jgi:hypothetical protein
MKQWWALPVEAWDVRTTGEVSFACRGVTLLRPLSESAQ